jgi:hypothetical protein
MFFSSPELEDKRKESGITRQEVEEEPQSKRRRKTSCRTEYMV